MNDNYNVFVGWSGDRSRLVAEFLRGWISKVVQSAKPWMSETDIEKGSRGLDEIAKALANIKVGITCLTPENLQRPWIFFEAGALSKTIGDRTRLCTYLIAGLEPKDVAPPLGMFQATKAVKKDTLKLVQTINRAVSDSPIPEEDLVELFDAMWPKLENRLATLPAPEETVTATRSVEDMVAEVLEIVRTEANRKSRSDVLSGISTVGLSDPIVANSPVQILPTGELRPIPFWRTCTEHDVSRRICGKPCVPSFSCPNFARHLFTGPHRTSLLTLAEYRKRL